MTLTSEIREGLFIAADAIRVNKLRSILTTLGLVIGIVTVTLMGTAIEGLNAAFLGSISVLGADVLHVDRFSWFNNSHQDWIKAQNRAEITVNQVREVERQMTLARAVAPYVETHAPIFYKNRQSGSVWLIGTTDQYLFTGGMTVADGRFLSPEEVQGARPVCVLGAKIVTNLFMNVSPLGQKVRLGPATFEVVGTLAAQGNFMGQFSLDNQVFIPVRQLVANFWGNPSCQIQVKAASARSLTKPRRNSGGFCAKFVACRPRTRTTSPSTSRRPSSTRSIGSPARLRP